MKHLIASIAGTLVAGLVAAAAPALAHAHAAIQDQAAGTATDQAPQGVTGFAPGTAIVPYKARLVLDDLANAANRSPDSKIMIVGHTDNVGDPEYNEFLGMDRAQLVRSALADRGVDVSRITVQSAGADNPVASNDTPEGRRQNRRAEAIIGDMESRMVGSSQGGTSATASGEGQRNGEQRGQQEQNGRTEDNKKYRQ